jgi:hypothetical protein
MAALGPTCTDHNKNVAIGVGPDTAPAPSIRRRSPDSNKGGGTELQESKLQPLDHGDPEAAEKSWRRLDGQLPKVILGVKLTDGIKLKPLPPAPFRHQDSAIARRWGWPHRHSSQ